MFEQEYQLREKEMEYKDQEFHQYKKIKLWEEEFINKKKAEYLQWQEELMNQKKTEYLQWQEELMNLKKLELEKLKKKEIFNGKKREREREVQDDEGKDASKKIKK